MKALSWLVAFALTAASVAAQDAPPSIAEKTSGMEHLEGFFDLYWDEGSGKLYWEIDKLDVEFLYQVSLASGLGSNPVGLDRGQLGGTHILEAKRVGPRVLLMEPNYGYRAISDNPAEVAAVKDAFAPSVHWGFPIEAETGGSVLVDATDFFLRDTHGAAARIERAGQGSFQVDRSRSVFHMPRTKAFPENTEIETLLTFTSSNPGPLVRSVAATGSAVTLRQHHSLVQLPDDDFEPRIADPRVGVFGPTFHDYATPIDESLVVRYTARHRLKKVNPEAARSEVVEPIVYYLDPGVPEPIRSALLDGARWWEDAFEAAGFIDGYRVEVLPEDADPQDARYNMIHWTHRSTRGWSYGGSITDPRTGEIIKGNVNLGSLRLRQDYLMGTGMVPPFTGGAGMANACGLSAAPGFSYLAQVGDGASPVEMALARVRQLSAHEVGHTLGFPHNYMASTYGGRASVMDYPAPLVHIRDGRLELGDAYAVGIGDYDKLSVRWLYGEFAPGTDEVQALAAIVEQGLRSETRFMAHTDNLIAAGAHPLASVWDNGGNLVDMLEHEIEVRKIGLDNFGEEVLRMGEPMSQLERRARAALSPPPVPDEGGAQHRGRRGVLLRDPRRRADADYHRARHRAAARTRRGAEDPHARLPRDPGAHSPDDPAAGLSLRPGRDLSAAHGPALRRAHRGGRVRGLHDESAAPSRAHGAPRGVPRPRRGPPRARRGRRLPDEHDVARAAADDDLPRAGEGGRRAERARRHHGAGLERRQPGPRARDLQRQARRAGGSARVRGRELEPAPTARGGRHPPLAGAAGGRRAGLEEAADPAGKPDRQS